MLGSENSFWTGVLCGAVISPFVIIWLVWFASLVGKRLKQMSSCSHQKTHSEDWPDGGGIIVCDDCRMSKYVWEQGEGSWQWIEDIPKARKELEEALKELAGTINKQPFIPGGKI